MNFGGLVCGIIIIICTLTLLLPSFTDVPNMLLGQILDYSKIDFESIPERNIVKNAIVIHLIEESDDACKVKAEYFGSIIEHHYFTRSAHLAEKLMYDKKQMTLVVPCDSLYGNESTLHIWYVIPESPVYAQEYTYFITN